MCHQGSGTSVSKVVRLWNTLRKRYECTCARFFFLSFTSTGLQTKKQNKPKKITSRTFLVATKLSLSTVIILRTRRGDVQFLVSSLLHKSSNSSSHTLDLLYSILSNDPSQASVTPPKDAAARKRESRARIKYNKYY